MSELARLLAAGRALRDEEHDIADKAVLGVAARSPLTACDAELAAPARMIDVPFAQHISRGKFGAG